MKQYFTWVLTIYIARYLDSQLPSQRHWNVASRATCENSSSRIRRTRLTANNPRFQRSKLVVVKILLSSLTTMTDDMVRGLSLHASTCRNALMTSSLSSSLSQCCFEKDSASSFVILIKRFSASSSAKENQVIDLSYRNVLDYWTSCLLSF